MTSSLLSTPRKLCELLHRTLLERIALHSPIPTRCFLSNGRPRLGLVLIIKCHPIALWYGEAATKLKLHGRIMSNCRVWFWSMSFQGDVLDRQVLRYCTQGDTTYVRRSLREFYFMLRIPRSRAHQLRSTQMISTWPPSVSHQNKVDFKLAGAILIPPAQCNLPYILLHLHPPTHFIALRIPWVLGYPWRCEGG